MIRPVIENTLSMQGARHDAVVSDRMLGVYDYEPVTFNAMSSDLFVFTAGRGTPSRRTFEPTTHKHDGVNA